MPAHRKQSIPPRLSPAKRRTFAIITLASPVALLVLLEMSLRLFHYGTDLSLFTTEIVNGRRYHVMNPEVRSRYFANMDFNPSSSVDDFLVPKPAGTYRIFCLGASTTVGYPYWYNGSFPTFLHERLQRIFPDKAIEVINLGMTATNSFTVVDMARDVAGYEPDLIIVYDGHNEFYGALGISSNESPGNSRWLTESYLRLLHLRTFLLLRDAYARVTGLFTHEAAPSRGTMMERMSYGNYIAYGSPTYRRALSMFEGNLDELKSICTKNGIPLIVSTQVSNLRDQPPLMPGNSGGQTPESAARLATLMDLGLTRIRSGKIDSALAAFRAAASLDSLRPDSHYYIARCLDSLGDRRSARREYVLARDYDQLRFRTSTDFNDAIRRMGDDRGVFVLDMERVFQDHSPDSLTGRTLIMEHLHPNSSGYFLMGEAFAEQMRSHQLLASAEEWRERDTIDDAEIWRDRSVSTLDELIAWRRTEILTGGWPFTSKKIPVVRSIAATDTLGQIAEEVTRGKRDWYGAHREAAAYYERRTDWDSVAREERVIISEMPLNVEPYLALAHAYLIRERYQAMVGVLLRSQTVQPTILACRALGDYALQTGKTLEAIKQYEQMSAFRQTTEERLDNGYLLALAYVRADMRDRAEAQLHRLLELEPGYRPAADMLSHLKGP
jgi:tetratricopeptide (TPR) repeat protein